MRTNLKPHQLKIVLPCLIQPKHSFDVITLFVLKIRKGEISGNLEPFYLNKLPIQPGIEWLHDSD